MNLEVVKKIDKNFLEHGTHEEFKAVIIELLNVIQAQSEQIVQLQSRVTDLENEIRRLKGEKKSLFSSRLIET